MQPMVNIALRAARSAGEMIVKSADNLDLVKVDEKGRHDFVTEVDSRSEETIIYISLRPTQITVFSGEESGISGNPDSPMWNGLSIHWMAPPILFAAFPMSPFQSPAVSKARLSTGLLSSRLSARNLPPVAATVPA